MYLVRLYASLHLNFVNRLALSDPRIPVGDGCLLSEKAAIKLPRPTVLPKDKYPTKIIVRGHPMSPFPVLFRIF